jgi:uncharacterized repeat protein (TIGR01451 family)
MRRPGIALIFMLVVAAGGRAFGTMVEGACITNSASATYSFAGSAKTISYNATTCVCVGTPSVMLRKLASPTLQASGGTVTFCVSFSNKSVYMSAVNFVITDVIPANMAFAGWGEAWYVDALMGTITQAYSLNAGVTWYSTGSPALGATATLRWVIPWLGIHASGMTCYLATVL